MAKRAGAYKSEKRKKELTRQKKQEEKRQRRIKKKSEESEPLDAEEVSAAGEVEGKEE